MEINKIKNDIYHQFFCDAYHVNMMGDHVHFSNNVFYSDSTAIGKIFNKNGRKILIYSGEKYSHTTAKHITKLLHACPPDIEKIKAPFYLNSLNFYFDDAKKEIERYLNIYTSEETSANIRDRFKYYYECAKNLNNSNLFEKIKIKKVWSKVYNEILKFDKKEVKRGQFCKVLNEIREDFEKSEKRKFLILVKKVKKASDEIKRIAISSGCDFMQLVRRSFNHDHEILTEKQKIENKILKISLLSEIYDYFFIDENKNNGVKMVTTSRRISYPVGHIMPKLREFCKNFADMRDTDGKLANVYNIYIFSNDYKIRVGCHYFHVIAILALAETLKIIDNDTYRYLVKKAVAECRKDDPKLFYNDKEKTQKCTNRSEFVNANN